MTNEQREKITALRHQGFGYTAIANSVGLSKHIVDPTASPVRRQRATALRRFPRSFA